jgi:predicted kinase
MDLDYQNSPYLSSFLIYSYIKKMKDSTLFEVLNFYKSYRAYVRGKVSGFQLSDPHISENEKEKMISIAERYFTLSHYYASLVTFELSRDKPVLFIVCGLTGTGKSTLAQKLSIDYHTHYLNTDIVRKERAGIDTYERHFDKINTGLYTQKKVLQTYIAMFERAEHYLRQGDNVVLDGTFQKRKYRDMARELIEKSDATIIFLRCICPEHIVRCWLDERLKKKTVSNGRWEIYMQQKTTFEHFHADEPHLLIDMSQNSFNERLRIFQSIVHTLLQVDR